MVIIDHRFSHNGFWGFFFLFRTLERCVNVTSLNANQEVPLAVTLSFIFFGLGFPLSIAQKVYDAYQEGYYSNFWNILSRILSLVALLIVTQFNGSLPLLVTAVYGSGMLVLAINGIFLFGFHRPWLLPKLRNVSFPEFKPLLGLGWMFIALQLTTLLLNQTDNFVIIRNLGPESVALYGTTWRLFSYVTVIQSWFLIPLWPAYSEALARKDKHWIRQTLKYSIGGIFLLTLFLSIALFFLADEIIKIWVGVELVPPTSLILCMAILQVILGWTQPFIIFLNGTSKLQGQVLAGLLVGSINLALTYVFVSWLGIVGAILATIISHLLITVWYFPLYSFKTLKQLK